MKRTPKTQRPSSEKSTILAGDISMDWINVVDHIDGFPRDHVFENEVAPWERGLGELGARARQAGYRDILVVCEPTGGYEKKFLAVARQLGFATAYVSPEAVSKMRVIETNDSGKTDIKDPHVIYTLASLGKTLNHRVLEDLYLLLREWGQIYDAAECGVVAAKCALHHQLQALFPDYNFKKDFLYSPSGIAVRRASGFNPFRILAAGRTGFEARVRKAVPRVRIGSINRLFEQAESSLRALGSPEHAQVLELRLLQLWDDYERHHARKTEARAALERLYLEIRSNDPSLPMEQKGIISTPTLARIFGELGPIGYFHSTRAIIRYAGLNLRERSSGKYRGQTKLSKKGRPLLRKILGQAILPLVKRNALYGKFYWKKKAHMPGTRAMTVVMRKFLKMLFGWFLSRKPFSRDRVFECESQFALAA